MSSKLILFSLLVFLSAFSLSLSKKNSNLLLNNKKITNVKILNAYGFIYEFKNNQKLHLIAKDTINSSEINNITLSSKNDSKIYKPKTICHPKDDYFDYLNENKTYFYCILDLTNIKRGNYSLEYFYYKNIKINDGNTLIEIKEKKKEVIELIQVNTKGFEHIANQNVILTFRNNDTNYSKITGLDIENNKSYLYIPIKCPEKGFKNNSVLCLANFTYAESARYYMKYIVYYAIPVNVEENVSFYINRHLKLLKITGEANTNDTSSFNLIFNKKVNTSLFSDFYLTDTKLNTSIYHINFKFNASFYNSSIFCLFNFKRIPIGTYYLNYIYKNKKYMTNITLTVEEKEIWDENELLNVYANFKRHEDNQVAYFSFYGKNKNSNLTYVVLNDGYSRINVLQTFGCEIIYYNNSYKNKYDLRCNLNLTYVDEGDYTLAEYSLNNEHYFIKKNINVHIS
jgi:hypothetical protein